MNLRTSLLFLTTLAGLFLLFGESDNQAEAGVFRGRRCNRGGEQWLPLEQTIRPREWELARTGFTCKQIQIITSVGTLAVNGSSKDNDGNVTVEVEIDPLTNWTLEENPKVRVFDSEADAKNAPTPTILGDVMDAKAGVTNWYKKDVTLPNFTLKTSGANNYWVVVWTISRNDEYYQIHRFPAKNSSHGWNIFPMPITPPTPPR